MNPPLVTESIRHATVRNLAYTAHAGIACFVLAFLSLHVLQPGLSPLDEAMSYYVHGRHGWLTTVGLLGLGLGSLTLTVAVAWTMYRTGARAGIACLAVWSVCVILGGTFPADPPGNWDKPMSVAGAIHGFAALVGLVVFPIAAVLLSRALRRGVQRRWISGIALILAIASAVSLLTFLASLAPALVTSGPPVLVGLTERIMLAAYATWLAAFAFALPR